MEIGLELIRMEIGLNVMKGLDIGLDIELDIGLNTGLRNMKPMTCTKHMGCVLNPVMLAFRKILGCLSMGAGASKPGFLH